MPLKKSTKPPRHIRAIGRMTDADWFELQLAAAASGKTFTKWATDHLLKAAEREGKRRDAK